MFNKNIKNEIRKTNQNTWSNIDVAYSSCNPQQTKYEPKIIHDLDSQQRAALELMNKGESVFLHGGYGSGASSVLNAFRHQNPEKKILFLAPDGVSAININGTNLYDFFSSANYIELIHPEKEPYRFFDFAKELSHNSSIGFNKEEILRQIDCIVFDDISRVSAFFFDATSSYISDIYDLRKSIYDIQVVVAGNFYEEPPEQANVPVNSFHGLDYLDSYAFCSPMWHGINFHAIELTNNYRQTEDELFRSVLDDLRTPGGDVKKAIQVLNKHEEKCRLENKPLDPFALELSMECPPCSIIGHTYHYPYPQDSYTYSASRWGVVNLHTCLIANILQLKLEDKVIFIADNPPCYTAGTVGFVTKLNDDEIHIRIKDGTIIKVGKHSWQYPNGAVTQFPLVSCKEISLRETHGMVLDSINITLGNQPLSVETLYSVLSKVKTLDGVRLDNIIDIKKISTDSNARAFYENKIDWDLYM